MIHPLLLIGLNFPRCRARYLVYIQYRWCAQEIFCSTWRGPAILFWWDRTGNHGGHDQPPAAGDGHDSPFRQPDPVFKGDVGSLVRPSRNWRLKIEYLWLSLRFVNSTIVRILVHTLHRSSNIWIQGFKSAGSSLSCRITPNGVKIFYHRVGCAHHVLLISPF